MKITNILEIDSTYTGYLIRLEDGSSIEIMIRNESSCCESWGFASSQDDLSYFIGSEFIKAEIVTDELKKVVLVDFYDGGAIFLDITTNLGVFQLAVYNSHNGYYSHHVYVKIIDKPQEDFYC